MIGFFTDPHPDELLYSACARFSDKMKYPAEAGAAQELFGGKYGMALIDFPNRLGHLISVMPPGHNYTVDRLIDEYTCLPFYEPFVAPERARIVRQEMRGDGYNRIHARLGIAADRFSQPTSLRFCPTCVVTDRLKYREAYWHRVHQLPGIEVCPDHAVFLESGAAPWSGRRNSNAFVSAERSIKEPLPRRIDTSDGHHNILLKLAQDAAWLLNWRGKAPSQPNLRDRYFNLLVRRGIACHNGIIRHKLLLEKFVSFYSTEALQSMQSEVGNRAECWLLRIVRTHKAGILQPPLRHLLLMTFLGVTAKDIFTQYQEYKPFGEGPWPCLNRASSHFGQTTIPEYRVRDGIRKLKGKPVGVFSCDCGFIYSRVGPDNSEKDRFNFTSVVSYGPVWEASLKNRWEDSSITLKELAKELNACTITLRRHALRLELPFPRESRCSLPASKEFVERYGNTRKTFEESLHERKERWLSVRIANPEASRNELISIARLDYYWLLKNSREWLEDNMPPSRKISPPPNRVNWEMWDVILSKAVSDSAVLIRGLPGYPLRVIKEAIIREVGHRSWIEKNLAKLPRTADAMNLALESGERFLLRCVEWAEACFCEEGTLPTRHKFEVKARTRTQTGSALQVQRAIDLAMERLHGRFHPK